MELGTSMFEKLNNLELPSLTAATNVSQDVSSKQYHIITGHENCTSYSKLQSLHECPRKYLFNSLEKLNQENAAEEPNVDFAFGHAVGAGIQTYAISKDINQAILAATLAWNAPFDLQKLDKRTGKPTKSMEQAIAAVLIFESFFAETFQDYEVLILPNGKPAVELSFGIDFENNFFHLGHIDVVLRNIHTNKLAVWEGKTTGSFVLDEAAYANSSQAVGYGVVVEHIAKLINASGLDYEVFYVVYSAEKYSFTLMPFVKSQLHRVHWIQDILLDHANLKTYKNLNFFPQRGDACLSKFNKRCKWFGTCNLTPSNIFATVDLKTISSLDSLPPGMIQFKFTLSELLATQKENVA